jgi:cytochrome c oxidase cbb3-type subunit III
MTPTRPALAALALSGLVLAGCEPKHGGSTAAPRPARIPADQLLDQIPLGAPPGEPVSLAASIRNPFEGDAQAVQEGKALFGAMNCVYCHGGQASGLIGPALNGQGWRYGGAPAQIYNSIHDGRPKGMPAWGARLPPDQIWKLVAYVESLGGAEPPATPGMAVLGGAAPSTTGPQPADQVQADTSHEALIAAQKGQRR